MTQLLPGERLDRLEREGLAIIQSREVFSFSLDAVLLAHFANVPRVKPAVIVDLCAGNGAVTMMLSAKTQNAIIGVEIQEQLVDMAQRSIAMNDLSQQVRMVHGDLKDALTWLPQHSVDVITCNPPYFAVTEQSVQNPNPALACARHELRVTLTEWVTVCAKLLKHGGKLFCVHRPERLPEILAAFTPVGLAAKCLQFVYPKAGRDANMVLIEAHRSGRQTGLKVLPPIVVYNDNQQYTAQMRGIFYGD